VGLYLHVTYMPSKDAEGLYLYFPESTVYFVMTSGSRWLLASHLESVGSGWKESILKYLST